MPLPSAEYSVLNLLTIIKHTMNETIQNYIQKAALNTDVKDIDDAFVEELTRLLDLESKENAEGLLTYKVPALGEGGTCSIAGVYEEEPYDLTKTFEKNGTEPEEYIPLVGKLNAIVELLHDTTGADWTGIYKKLKTDSGLALVKLAYRGNPSRAEFPLTKEFAETSNNSTVGLSGKAVLANSINSHKEDGKPYYVCDIEVKSELCVPIFSKEGEVIGIIDVESFKENFFDSETVLKVAIVCALLADVF